MRTLLRDGSCLVGFSRILFGNVVILSLDVPNEFP
jgi:hypothetical protein